MTLIKLDTLSPADFPSAEDDGWEFKSSQTKADKLKEKLSCAASALANSGGGVFVWGVDGNGDPNGGVDQQIGRQDLRDWLDQVVNQVSPRPDYEIRIYIDVGNRGTLDAGKAIAAVSVAPSESGPRQASDKKYYIRAGAHTEAAGHYIVEALWARRQVAKPILTAYLRVHPSNKVFAQLCVVALNESPAINICLDVSPVNGKLAVQLAKHFPLHIPLVDIRNPFRMIAAFTDDVSVAFDDTVIVSADFSDVAGNRYSFRTDSPLWKGIPPIYF